MTPQTTWEDCGTLQILLRYNYLPIYFFLPSCGVDFQFGIEVKDMKVTDNNTRQTITGFYIVQGGLELHKNLGENDIVTVTWLMYVGIFYILNSFFFFFPSLVYFIYLVKCNLLPFNQIRRVSNICHYNCFMGLRASLLLT